MMIVCIRGRKYVYTFCMCKTIHSLFKFELNYYIDFMLYCVYNIKLNKTFYILSIWLARVLQLWKTKTKYQERKMYIFRDERVRQNNNIISSEFCEFYFIVIKLFKIKQIDSMTQKKTPNIYLPTYIYAV